MSTPIDLRLAASPPTVSSDEPGPDVGKVGHVEGGSLQPSQSSA
jgi:hypothetical protein